MDVGTLACALALLRPFTRAETCSPPPALSARGEPSLATTTTTNTTSPTTATTTSDITVPNILLTTATDYYAFLVYF